MLPAGASAAVDVACYCLGPGRAAERPNGGERGVAAGSCQRMEAFAKINWLEAQLPVGSYSRTSRRVAPGEKWAHFKLPLSVPGGSKKGPLNPHFKPPLLPLNRLLNPHHRF